MLGSLKVRLLTPKVPFITHPTARFAIDDHLEWVFNGNYYCIAKDSRGAWSEYPDGSINVVRI